MSGTEAESNQRNRSKTRFLWIGITVVVLIAAVCSILLMSRASKPLSAEEKVPNNVFYMKGKAVYHTFIDEIKPQQVIPEYDFTGGTKLYVSGDGKWLFYPSGEWENANLFRCSLHNVEEGRQKIVSKAAMFTTNYDASRLVYLADRVLYATFGKETKEIAGEVERYFTNQECDTFLYLTTDQILYFKKGNQEARKLDENVWFRYVSPDLNTIYYVHEGTLYLVKNGETPKKIQDINPYSLIICDNEDIYLSNMSEGEAPLFHYSKGVSTELIHRFIYYLSNFDYALYYPYRTLRVKSDPPVIMAADVKGDAYVIKGSQVIKKITGGYLTNALVSPDGRELYYMAMYEDRGLEGDLFHVSIDGTTVSGSRRIDTNVTGSLYLDKHFLYFKNGEDYPTVADMYKDGKMIDSGVLTWGIQSVGNSGAFVYPVNSKDYMNDDQYYTCDTIMLYQDGNSRKVSDNVIDYIICGERIVYLWVENLDATEGTLHLYDTITGSDIIVDTGVKQFVRPKKDSERDSEINLKYRIGDHYP